MKALYDRGDRDYYILFGKGDIVRLMRGETLACFLYARTALSPRSIAFERKKFEVYALETNIDLHKKDKELSNSEPKISHSYSGVLIVYGDYELEVPEQLFISKEWMREGLSQESLDRCGKNEQWYGSGGCKVHFHSEDSKHFMTSQTKLVFEMEEAAWNRDYGKFEVPSSND